MTLPSRTPDTADLPEGPTVSVGWLARNLDRVVVVDASAMDHRGADTGIPGARRFDLDGEMSSETELPHTMLPAGDFAERLGRLGIGQDTVVVAYDRAGMFSSARAWWMLRATGVGTPYVLDGGFPAWVAAGQLEGPLDLDPPHVDPPRITIAEGAFIDDAEVAARLQDPAAAVVDVRSAERFAGTAPEPRPGLRSGHMPGAVNMPFSELAPGGFLLEQDELARRFDDSLGGRERVAFSCGSGVTACVGALAAVVAGRRDVTVYDGSWSDWGRESQDPQDRPVVRGT
ncbi:sulfurtransferase [Kocuria coralli]|uniref:Sulfurtransferase n=1 Tax=Kocuria coralli TaxID=1461025 RepID=A0A5J5KT89_9MICC|nr:sulfurtransferase [Kocuria coralli]KAA9392987.1 sulfurtransferase [Kocuria coralli]